METTHARVTNFEVSASDLKTQFRIQQGTLLVKATFATSQLLLPLDHEGILVIRTYSVTQIRECTAVSERLIHINNNQIVQFK